MCVSLGIVAEDDVARRVACDAVERRQVPIFKNNNGPFVDVWFGDQRLFGLVERLAPNDLVQIACESDDDGDGSGDGGAATSLRITQDVSFVLRLSSVPHATLRPRVRAEDNFMNCVQLVVEYASLLQRGMCEEVINVDGDDEAEYIYFTKK